MMSFIVLGNRVRFTIFELELPVELKCDMGLLVLSSCTASFVPPLYLALPKWFTVFKLLGLCLHQNAKSKYMYLSRYVLAFENPCAHTGKNFLSLIFRLILSPQTHVVMTFSRLWKANEKCSLRHSIWTSRIRITFTPAASFCCPPLWHPSNNSKNNPSYSPVYSKQTMFVRFSIPRCFVIRRHDLFLTSEENAIPRTTDKI